MSAPWKIRWISGSLTAPSVSVVTTICTRLLLPSRDTKIRACAWFCSAPFSIILVWPSACFRCSSRRRKGVAPMTWANFYLLCFFLGFALSLLSFLGNWHLHLPHFDINLGGAHAHARSGQQRVGKRLA